MNFKKKGKTVFIAPTFVGYVGIFTGIAENKYSIALNYRRSKGTLFGNLKKALTMVWPIGFLLRYSMEQEYNITNLIEVLSETEIISPCYITIVSPDKETTVLVRDPKLLVEKKFDDNYLIQTNNDVVSTGNILYSNERKKLAKDVINKLKSDSYYEILKAFYSYPIINEETVYISIMDPQLALLILLFQKIIKNRRFILLTMIKKIDYSRG